MQAVRLTYMLRDSKTHTNSYYSIRPDGRLFRRRDIL